MNDDVDAAEAHLSKGSSPFHQVHDVGSSKAYVQPGAHTIIAWKGCSDVHESYSGL